MSLPTKKEEAAKVIGQARLFQYLHGVVNTAALRCAVKLDIAGIVKGHDRPITLSEIADKIGSSSLNVDGLSRLMRFLVKKRIFDEVFQPDSQESAYSLNECSEFLVKDARNTLAPLVVFMSDTLNYSPFFNLDEAIMQGCTAAFKTYGCETFELYSRNPEASKSFNEAVVGITRNNMDGMLSSYGFDKLEGTLVDIGGGIGAGIAEIVTKYPHLKGINFDLPHVVASAPAYEGVTHVGGDMFASVPPADSYFMKGILHNWSDDKCVQILKNCRQSITKKTGKVIIAELVIFPKGGDVFDEMCIEMDLMMLTSFHGKERTDVEWRSILEKAGFSRYNFVKIPATVTIMEAFIE